MALSLKELIITYQANAQPVLDALSRIDSKLKSTSQQLRATGESFTRIGTEIGLTLSLPLILLGKSSISALADLQSLEAGFSSVMAKFDTGLSVTEATSQELAFMKKTAQDLGVSFQTISRPYLQYLASSRDSLEISRKTITSFLGVGSALGMTSSQVELMIKALQQMQSKGTVMAEELKGQLGDTMPGAIKLFADAAGVGTAEFLKMMEQGKVSSSILNDVSDQINKNWGGAIDKGAKTIRANLNRVTTSFFFLRAELGKGLDEFTGLNNKLNAFSGWLERVAINFSRLNPQAKAIILSVGLFVAALAPVLIILGSLIKLVGTLVTVFRAVIVPLRALTILMAANPFGAFLVATTLIITYWNEIIGIFKTAWGWISKIFGLKQMNPLERKETANKANDNPTNLKPALSSLGSLVSSGVGSFNNMLSNRGLLPESFKSGGAFNSPVSNTNSTSTTQKNYLTVNIPAGMKASDSNSLKEAIKSALQEQNKQSYMELAI